MRTTYYPILLLIIFLGGCALPSTAPDSAIEDSREQSGPEELAKSRLPANSAPSTVPVPVKELPKKTKRPGPVDEVQLLWAIPEAPVDSYIIYYGFARDKLDRQVNIPQAEVETLKDPRFGKVHRYLLSNIPIDKTVYVTIAAMRGSVVSKTGEVIELKPDAK